MRKFESSKYLSGYFHLLLLATHPLSLTFLQEMRRVILQARPFLLERQLLVSQEAHTAILSFVRRLREAWRRRWVLHWLQEAALFVLAVGYERFLQNPLPLPLPQPQPLAIIFHE